MLDYLPLLLQEVQGTLRIRPGKILATAIATSKTGDAENDVSWIHLRLSGEYSVKSRALTLFLHLEFETAYNVTHLCDGIIYILLSPCPYGSRCGIQVASCP